MSLKVLLFLNWSAKVSPPSKAFYRCHTNFVVNITVVQKATKRKVGSTLVMNVTKNIDANECHFQRLRFDCFLQVLEVYKIAMIKRKVDSWYCSNEWAKNIDANECHSQRPHFNCLLQVLETQKNAMIVCGQIYPTKGENVVLSNSKVRKQKTIIKWASTSKTFISRQ